MSKINSVKVSTRPESHVNHMGGTSYSVEDPILELRIAASSCFFGEPMYYTAKTDVKQVRTRTPKPIVHRQVTPTLAENQFQYLRSTLGVVTPKTWRTITPQQLLESAIDKALDHNVEKTLQEAVRLRNDEHIRVTPQVILVRAANHSKAKKTGLIRKYAGLIMSRADEPATCLAYQLSTFGKPIPNSLKRAFSDKLQSFKEYHLGKYRLEDHVVKAVDVVNLSHAYTPAIDKLIKGELKNTGKTWEAIISAQGSTKAAWSEAVDVMGHMGLLRNIRNLLDKGIDPDWFCPKLIETAETGKQLPFRYVSAYNAVKDKAPGVVLDAIETAMLKSFVNLPKLKGKTVSLCDNSGSTRGTPISELSTMKVSEIANLSGVLAALASDSGEVVVFGDHHAQLQIRKRASIFDQLKEANRLGQGVGAATEHGVWEYFDKITASREHVDNIFVYSDQQAGHGGLYGVKGQYRDFIYSFNAGHGQDFIDVAKLVQRYRSVVNPRVNVFLVQVAGYKDVLIPEYYNRTYILGGWGDSIINFAASVINTANDAGWGQQVA